MTCVKCIEVYSLLFLPNFAMMPVHPQRTSVFQRALQHLTLTSKGSHTYNQPAKNEAHHGVAPLCCRAQSHENFMTG